MYERRVKKTFTTSGVEISYYVETSTGIPDADEGSVGDVREITDTPARVMVKHNDGWKEFTPDDRIPFPNPNPYRRLKIKYEFDTRKKAWRDYRSVQTSVDNHSRNSKDRANSNKSRRLAANIRTIPCNETPNSTWVNRLISQWRTSAPASYGTFEPGHGVLNALARHPTNIPYIKLSDVNSGSILRNQSLIELLPLPVSTILPSMALVFDDLDTTDLGSLLVVDATTGVPTTVASKGAIHYCFAKIADRCSPGNTPFINISNIPATPSGLGRCRMKSPFTEAVEAVFERIDESEEATPLWSSDLTATGSIIPPHCVGYGRSEVVYHIEGQKLCFVWPSTARNLDAILEQHRRPNRYAALGIQDAILSLEGLQVYFFDRPTIYAMPCHAIHASMAFTLCSNATFAFRTLSSLPDAQRVIASYVKLAQQPIANQHPETRHFFARFLNEVVESELDPWRTLALRYPSTVQGSEIAKWVEDTTSVITDLKSMYDSVL
ncbi:hypothetical protein V5O48_007696 [Marasmius crinis-equi]|uniref:JmjC domain-containing protein n=1 Tax=Marasmius crinis-equi TaxID=585013 RepID=A0ABR3FFX9_9AGAR